MASENVCYEKHSWNVLIFILSRMLFNIHIYLAWFIADPAGNFSLRDNKDQLDSRSWHIIYILLQRTCEILPFYMNPMVCGWVHFPQRSTGILTRNQSPS